MDLEGIKIARAGAKSSVTILVDSDSRPDLDQLEVISQEVSNAFDRGEESKELNFGAGYTLEVSTPGVDAPLIKPRQWKRNQGRKVAITTDGKKELGRIGALNDAETHVIVITRNGKKLDLFEHELASDAKAVVEIEFSNVPEEEKLLAARDFEQAIAWREENK